MTGFPQNQEKTHIPGDLECADKVNGTVLTSQRIEVSADGKTLTMTVRNLGREKPNRMVFDRE